MNTTENNTIEYRFNAPELHDFMGNIRREWALTNGIGGYAGSSILGAHNRTHQGYLIASLHPPVERYLVFSKINEMIIQDGNCYDLTTAQHRAFESEADSNSEANSGSNAIISDGNRYLTEFLYDGTIRFTYQAGSVTMLKSLTLVHGQNTAAISYEIINDGPDAQLTLTPLMNYREHSTSSTPESLRFTTTASMQSNASTTGTEATVSYDNDYRSDTAATDIVASNDSGKQGIWFSLTPEANPDITITFSCSEGTLLARRSLYDVNMLLQTEVDNETDGLDCHYTPYDIKIKLPAHATSRISVVCTVIDNAIPTITDLQACNLQTDSLHSDNIHTDSLHSGSLHSGSSQTDFPTYTNGSIEYLTYAGSLDNIDGRYAFRLIAEEKSRIRAEINHAGYSDHFANMLVLATGQFLSLRQSTGLTTVLAGLPWFTDWGRDTMIAFTGLTLATGRSREAREILSTFAQYVHHGLVPNMFPDNGMDPLYNTADASLWYFYAVYEYLQYNNTPEDYEFIHSEIFPKLLEIADAYQHGTDFSISMDEDGLIRAGSDLDQITWMDVRVGDWVATPRHGKPVEINALWYNALRILEQLCRYYADNTHFPVNSTVQPSKILHSLDFAYEENASCAAAYIPESIAYSDLADSYKSLADKVKESFAREFWNESGGYLYDVIGCPTENRGFQSGEPNSYPAGNAGLQCNEPAGNSATNKPSEPERYKDDSLRPNQIYAVSLPFSLLSPEQEASVVETVQRELFAGTGLRSLASGHPDYHPIYLGSLDKRDHAYHQGTSWGFLLGGFYTAYMKVHGHSRKAAQTAKEMLFTVEKHMCREGCIGSISEIFDGDAPHHSRGCYAQAWSVGEMLRCYTQDILPYLL